MNHFERFWSLVELSRILKVTGHIHPKDRPCVATMRTHIYVVDFVTSVDLAFGTTTIWDVINGVEKK